LRMTDSEGNARRRFGHRFEIDRMLPAGTGNVPYGLRKAGYQQKRLPAGSLS
jgi:hypothetical protein